VGSSYQGTLRALYASIKELRGRLEFYSPSKGIVIFTKPWYSLYATMTMVVEINALPGGCWVSLNAFLAGNPFRPRWASGRYERAFAKRVEGHLS
jgi:hypothetical protein